MKARTQKFTTKKNHELQLQEFYQNFGNDATPC